MISKNNLKYRAHASSGKERAHQYRRSERQLYGRTYKPQSYAVHAQPEQGIGVIKYTKRHAPNTTARQIVSACDKVPVNAREVVAP